MHEPIQSLRQTYILAITGIPVLIFYAAIQSGVAVFVAQEAPKLKLVMECPLLILGIILHVHWRKVDQSFREMNLLRPRWIAVADCASFVITFWAAWILASAFFT